MTALITLLVLETDSLFARKIDAEESAQVHMQE